MRPLRHHYNKMHRFPFGYPAPLELRTSFWMAAHWVWERRATAKKSGMPFSEETITDTILIDLATQHPDELKIFPLNKFHEGKTGADWEWCFYDQKAQTYQPMLVQAKLLDDQDKNYSHLNRMIGSSGIRQMDRLIETASTRLIPTPAIFVFYNHLSKLDTLPNNCELFSCEECWGCSIALAETVRASNTKKFEKLKNHSKPWICLFCQGLNFNADLPSRVIATLNDLYDRAIKSLKEANLETENITRPPKFPSTEKPPYFDRLLEFQSVESASEREKIIRKIAYENPNVDAIILAKERVSDG
jgi:hypothetical protein